MFEGIFGMIDVDHSGTIDGQELTRCMALLGLDFAEDQVKRVISAYDVDKSGEIESDEFVSWAMTEYLKGDDNRRGVMMDTSANKEWLVPHEGTLRVDFIADPMPPGADLVGSDDGISGLLKNISRADTESERQVMLSKALDNSDIFLTAKQAQTIFEHCNKGQDKLVLIMQLMPQILEPRERCELVDSVLDLYNKVKLKVKLAGQFGSITGNPTGFYLLDLSDEGDRMAARKIAEFANYERRIGKALSGRGDTSQKGNWENFRNEMFMGKPFVLTAKWFTDIPKQGERLKCALLLD